MLKRFVITVRNSCFGKIMFSRVFVILFIVCIPACTRADTPLVRHPPSDTPLGRPPPWADPLPGQTPPHDGQCSGRYASYWNAFLLLKRKRNQKRHRFPKGSQRIQFNVHIERQQGSKTVFDFPKSQKIAPVLRWRACSDCLISRSISQHWISGSISQHQNSGSISQYWICWKPLPSHQLIMVNNILDLQVYFPVLDLRVFPSTRSPGLFPSTRALGLFHSTGSAGNLSLPTN